MLICIHHKTYGSENKNKKIEHIVYKKSPKVTQVYYTLYSQCYDEEQNLHTVYLNSPEQFHKESV